MFFSLSLSVHDVGGEKVFLVCFLFCSSWPHSSLVFQGLCLRLAYDLAIVAPYSGRLLLALEVGDLLVAWSWSPKGHSGRGSSLGSSRTTAWCVTTVIGNTVSGSFWGKGRARRRTQCFCGSVPVLVVCLVCFCLRCGC